ncbi:hypothetical protein [Komagataeibacter sp. FNDCF1]|uniref:hypothetical protein n=1 Tax=Komagataeibacter sp. FNDCF1 TaxID=2878681 RepID=UPI001E659DCA|nr:hypothetical protein [Komagataeibacter sp. FNDCF1]MCE2564176.1 hypothetical protein [Komagataeibacter sp. FNDCF1]
MKVPEYRVRLFLSVDLTGSTAFKHKQQNTLKWIKAFQNFYGEFPKLLRNEYSKVCSDGRQLVEDERENGYPKLWKTVGDEILFCCRLRSAIHLEPDPKVFQP